MTFKDETPNVSSLAGPLVLFPPEFSYTPKAQRLSQRYMLPRAVIHWVGLEMGGDDHGNLAGIEDISGVTTSPCSTGTT